MGAKICHDCQTTQNVHDVEPRIVDEPDPAYAEPKDPDNVPYTVRDILRDKLNERQIDAGDVERGMKIDICYIIHPFDVYYTGEWKQGVPQGVGEIVLQNNSILKATFVQGVASGKDCILVMDDGSYYRGGIQNNQFFGKGQFVTQNGHIYEGEWTNNVPNGRGQQQFSDGEKYEGNFKDGLKSDGNGSYTWKHHPNLYSYVGGFIDGRMQGEGTLTTKNGAQIRGNFKNNIIQNATITNVRQNNRDEMMNGELNNNEVGNNQQRGNEIRYQGKLINGLLDGQGIVTNIDGTKKKGIWFEGCFLHGRNEFSDQQIRQCLKLISQNFERQTYEEIAIDNIIKELNEKYPNNKFEAKFINQTDIPEFKSKKSLIADMRNKCLVILKNKLGI